MEVNVVAVAGLGLLGRGIASCLLAHGITAIASNTSALPITLLQCGRKYPERFVGMHWAEPAHATRFLELIRGEQTTDACLQSAVALATRLGKDPCIVQHDVPGFIANRI